MPDYLLFKKDVARDVRAHYAPDIIMVERLWVEINLPDDRGLLKGAFKDPLLLDQMQRTVASLVDHDLTKLLAYQIAMADKEAQAARAEGNDARFLAAVRKVPALLDSTQNQIVPRLQSAAQDVWRQLTRTKKEYATYQVKCGVKIAASVTNMAIGVVVAVGSGGTGLVVTLYGLVKSGVDLLRNITSMSEDAETAEKGVKSALASAMSVFKTGLNRNVAGFFEIGRTAVSELAAIELPTPSRCKELNDVYKAKVQGLDVQAHKTAEALQKILDSAAQLQRSISAENKRASLVDMGSALKREAEQLKALGQLEARVNEAIAKVIKLNERVGAGVERHKGYEETITALQKKMIPTWAPPLQKVLGFGLGAGVGAEALEDVVQGAAFAFVETFGDDVIDAVVAKWGKPETRLEVSSPRFLGTSANLGAMKLQPIGAPKISPRALPPLPQGPPPTRPRR